jgi:hypothetical protein
MMYIFYFTGILALIWELIKINSPELILSYFKIIAKNKHDLNLQQVIFVLLIIGYIIWSLIGLFSSQWILFFLLILLEFILRPVNKFIIRVDGILRFLLLLFILINKFHLHINIFELIKNLIL